MKNDRVFKKSRRNRKGIEFSSRLTLPAVLTDYPTTRHEKQKESWDSIMNLMTARGVFKDSSAHRNSIESHCVASISPAVSTAVSLNTRRGGTKKERETVAGEKVRGVHGFLIIARLSPPLRLVRERIRLLGLARHKRVLTLYST